MESVGGGFAKSGWGGMGGAGWWRVAPYLGIQTSFCVSLVNTPLTTYTHLVSLFLQHSFTRYTRLISYFTRQRPPICYCLVKPILCVVRYVIFAP